MILRCANTDASPIHACLGRLTACTLLDRVEAPVSAQPALSIDEQLECEQAVLEREQFRPALDQHDGISDTPLVMVDILRACYYGT
jgi:Cu2+-containing amine oxidase